MSVENQWYVRLPNGNVITVSLDDLDAAFQRGDVNEQTLVYRQGMRAWLPLGQAAGLDDADAVVPPAPLAPPAPPAPPAAPYSEPMSVRPVSFDRATPTSFEAYGRDMDLSLEAPQWKSSKKKVILGALAVAAAVGLGVLGLSSLSGGDATAAATSVASPVVAAAPPPAPTPIPEAQSASQNRLSDEQRKALMQFDDKQKADAAKRAQDRAAKMPRGMGRRTKDKDVFVKSGNKYDPLNSSL